MVRKTYFHRVPLHVQLRLPARIIEPRSLTGSGNSHPQEKDEHMYRMIVLSTALFAGAAIAGPQDTPPPVPPAASTAAPQGSVAGDPSSTCAYLTVNQGEIPESRDIFDAVITQIDGKSTPLSRTNRYRIAPGPHVLTVADLAALENYVIAVATMRQAHRELQATGLLIAGKRNPVSTILLQAQQQQLRAAGELGLTPYTRGRVGPAGTDDDEDFV